jgi:hypothetical protein
MSDKMPHSRAARRRTEDRAAAREKRVRETERQVVEEEARRKTETGRLREQELTSDVAKLETMPPTAIGKPMSTWRRYGEFLRLLLR